MPQIKIDLVQDVFTIPPISSITSGLTQQDKVNVFNTTSYSNSANAVKLLSPITNNNGKIKLYTESNSNIVVNDVIFIMFDDTSAITYKDAYIMDNYLEFSDCQNWTYLKQMQGYKVIEINESNNEITIDRYYDSRFVGKKLYNHYISKIYMRRLNITSGEIDGAIIREAHLNATSGGTSDTAIDITVTQMIVLSGESFYIDMKNKYDSAYITTNSTVNTGTTTSYYKPYTYKGANISNQDPTPVSSYYSKNNKNYGYNYTRNTNFWESTIDNGYYDHCVLKDCILNGGYYNNCELHNCEIYGGDYINTPIDLYSKWLNGNWSGGTFTPKVWYNGVWNGGNLEGIEWRNGVFNGGTISGSTWLNGMFQGGVMNNCVWTTGVFNNGLIKNSTWNGGTFNGGQMQGCSWKDGTCSGGELTNIFNWNNGTFNGGIMTSSIWLNGVFNGGSLLNSYWSGGTFNNGTFNANNSADNISGGTVRYTNTNNGWLTGSFYNGNFSNSVWSGGTFYGGSFDSGSLWYSGAFKYGNFNNSYWSGGTFENGNVTNSYFHNVNWKQGTWNSGIMGVVIGTEYPAVYWSGGTFNDGIFGNSNPSSSIYWYGGSFYGGNFSGSTLPCPVVSGDCGYFSGFYDGIFYGGNFTGIFFGGSWSNGVFVSGCKLNSITTDTIQKINPVVKRQLNKRFGEVSFKNPQQKMNTN